MPSWQEKVVRVMMAETSDLRELARIAGRDPATFWRDANFRRADLSGQDLRGLDVSAAKYRATKKTDPDITTEPPDLPDDPWEWGNHFLTRGLEAMDQALLDWPHADEPLVLALDAFRRSVDAFVSLSDAAGAAGARKRLAEALLLRAHAAPEHAKDAIDTAEYELRKATLGLDPADTSAEAISFWDARGMALRTKSRNQAGDVAVESLKRAQAFFEKFPGQETSALTDIRKMALSREIFLRRARKNNADYATLSMHVTRLERICSPVTGPQPADITAAAQIEYSAHRLTVANVNRIPVGSKAREEIRDTLVTAMRSATYLDWIEAQRCLAELDGLAQAQEAPQPEAASAPTLDAARSEALRRAQACVAEGDAHLRALISAPELGFQQIDPALDCYAKAEDLYGMLEDVALIDGEAGRAYAIMRRGIAHLLKTTDGALTGQAQAEACMDARFALDLASASLAGRTDVPLALAEALDAQAFGLRIEAHVSTSAAAVDALSEAAALHRRASRIADLPRAISYRYRTHVFGAERELEERQSADPGKFQQARLRSFEALQKSEGRKLDRTSAAEQAAHMAILAEYAMSVTAELRLTPPAGVAALRAKTKQHTDETIEEAMNLARSLFMPLDWIVLERTRAQLQRLENI